MHRNARSLVLLAAAGSAAFALFTAPIAGAEPGSDEPLLPSCEPVDGSSVLGGQKTECATPGNAQIDATPEYIPGNFYGGFYGFPGSF